MTSTTISIPSNIDPIIDLRSLLNSDMLMWLSTINAAYIYHDTFPSQDEHTQERMANDKRIAMFIDELEDSRIGQAMDSLSSSDFPSAISSVQDRRASNLPTQALFQKGSEATKTVKDEEVFHDSNDSSTPAKKVEVKDTPTEDKRVMTGTPTNSLRVPTASMTKGRHGNRTLQSSLFAWIRKACKDSPHWFRDLNPSDPDIGVQALKRLSKWVAPQDNQIKHKWAKAFRERLDSFQLHCDYSAWIKELCELRLIKEYYGLPESSTKDLFNDMLTTIDGLGSDSTMSIFSQKWHNAIDHWMEDNRRAHELGKKKTSIDELFIDFQVALISYGNNLKGNNEPSARNTTLRNAAASKEKDKTGPPCPWCLKNKGREIFGHTEANCKNKQAAAKKEKAAADQAKSTATTPNKPAANAATSSVYCVLCQQWGHAEASCPDLATLRAAAAQMRAGSQASVASEARATAIYENKESNNYPDLTSRIAHFRFVSQYLFHEAPEVMLPEVINMIEERRSAERATKPRKHTPLFKTERLMEMKFPSSSEDNPTIKHVWQTDAETRNERAERAGRVILPGEQGFKIPRKRDQRSDRSPPPGRPASSRRIMADKVSAQLYEAINQVYRPMCDWSRPSSPCSGNETSKPCTAVSAARSILAITSARTISPATVVERSLACDRRRRFLGVICQSGNC